MKHKGLKAFQSFFPLFLISPHGFYEFSQFFSNYSTLPKKRTSRQNIRKWKKKIPAIFFPLKTKRKPLRATHHYFHLHIMNLIKVYLALFAFYQDVLQILIQVPGNDSYKIEEWFNGVINKRCFFLFSCKQKEGWKN